MASKPLDTYIKTPPPSNPASKETYLEQQLGSIERVLQKHTNTIEENYANNVASITEEQGVRATADSALAYSLQQLTATVNANNTSTQGQITNLQTAVADASSATATQLQTLTAKVDTDISSTNAAISNEQKARATADSALASKISTLTAQAEFNNSKLQASITNEATARVTADTAEATARESLRSFVGWDGNSYTSTLVQTMGTKVSKTDGASYEWSVQGSIDGATGGLRLTGAKRLNPTTNVVETTANLIIDANTRINGDLLVTGTVAAARLATIPGSKLASSGSDLITAPNIKTYEVSDNQANVAIGTSSSGIYNMNLAVGDRVTIIGYGGGSAESSNGGSGILQVYYASPTYPGGVALGGSLVVKAFCRSVTSATGFTSTTGYFVSLVGSNYSLPPASILQVFTASVAGLHNFSVYNTTGGDTGIVVIRLSR